METAPRRCIESCSEGGNAWLGTKCKLNLKEAIMNITVSTTGGEIKVATAVFYIYTLTQLKELISVVGVLGIWNVQDSLNALGSFP